MLRDMNIAVAATDHRAIEVLASGLPLHHGVQLAVDITIRCAHTAESSSLTFLTPQRFHRFVSFGLGPEHDVMMWNVNTIVDFRDHLASLQ